MALTLSKRLVPTGLIVAPLLVCLAPPASADVVHTLDDEPADGRFTLAEGDDLATLTAEDGTTTAIRLTDLDEVRFGEELVVVRSGHLLLINNDQGQWGQVMTAKIKLRAGLHRFVVPYWQAGGEHNLKLQVFSPGIGQAELNSETLRCFRSTDENFEDSPGIDDEGYRLPELGLKAGDDRRRFLSRARYRFYVGDESMPFNNVGVLGQLALKRTNSTTSAINTGMVQEPDSYFGLVFEGFFRAPEDGEYAFMLNSDDGSQLYFGRVDRFKAENLGTDNAGPTPWRAELKSGGTARGEVVGIIDNALTMKLGLGDESPAQAAVPLNHTAAIWDTTANEEQFNRDNEPADLDTAYIRDKDDAQQIRSVNGRVIALSDETLTFEFRGKERAISRERLVGLVFAHAERPAAPKPGFHQTLRFRTGQALPGRLVTLGDTVEFELLGSGQRLEAPRQALIALRTENGRRIDLTRTKPTAEEAVPYFSVAMPSVVNRSFAGGKIRLFDQNTYNRGIAVHSKSRLHYKLERPAETFRARFGLMDPGGRLGDVTARVLGDGEVLWQQEGITAATGPVDVEVALAGIERLVLEVDFGEGQNVGDRAAWCDPQIIFENAQ